jgi:putative molybdopterin biosynthesis protein
MTKITIRPTWRFETELGDALDPRLFRLLQAIQATGALTLAVRDTDMSYRHAWDLLKHATAFFGSPLVTMARGKGAHLTTLGEKLLWAERRSDASLFPQLDNVASELNLEIGKARQAAQAVIRIHASHGYAVEKLPQLMADHGSATVDLQYMGSVDALASLSRSNCDLAGFHVPLGPIGGVLWEQYAQWLNPRQEKVIRLVLRTQGLIVAAGNPKHIQGLQDLQRPDVRFINRQRGSGTRILLDGLLRAHAIDPAQIAGYGNGEFTHAAVAAFVSSGMVDAAFGVEPAARQFKLEFLPIAQERYMFACGNETLTQPAVRELCRLLASPEYAQLMVAVPGYTLDEPGEIAPIGDIVPR